MPCWSVSLTIQIPCGPSLSFEEAVQWIRGLRRRRLWSQRAAAAQAGVALATWRAWESPGGGRPGRRARWRLLRVIAWDADWLGVPVLPRLVQCEAGRPPEPADGTLIGGRSPQRARIAVRRAHAHRQREPAGTRAVDPPVPGRYDTIYSCRNIEPDSPSGP